jgi:hypothetical protein
MGAPNQVKVLVEVDIYPGEEQELCDIIRSEMMRECEIIPYRSEETIIFDDEEYRIMLEYLTVSFNKIGRATTYDEKKHIEHELTCYFALKMEKWFRDKLWGAR